MKTQVQQKLNFKKNSITELNDIALRAINGGSEIAYEGGIDISRFTSQLCNSTRTGIISQ